MNMEGFCLDSFILTGGRVEEYQLHWRNVELSLMTGNSKELIDHASFKAIGSEFGLVGLLSIVAVEVLGKFYDRLLDKLQVTNATHNNLHVYWVIGLDFGLIDSSRNAELAYSTGEVCRTLRKRLYFDVYAWCLDGLLDFNIS